MYFIRAKCWDRIFTFIAKHEWLTSKQLFAGYKWIFLKTLKAHATASFDNLNMKKIT